MTTDYVSSVRSPGTAGWIALKKHPY